MFGEAVWGEALRTSLTSAPEASLLQLLANGSIKQTTLESRRVRIRQVDLLLVVMLRTVGHLGRSAVGSSSQEGTSQELGSVSRSAGKWQMYAGGMRLVRGA